VFRLLALNAFSALLLVLILSVFGGVAASSYLTDFLTENFEARALQLIERIDREVYERWLDVQVLARNPLFTDPDTPIELQRAYLDVVRERYDFFSWVGFVDAEGVVLAGSGAVMEGESVAMQPAFINGKRALYVGDLHDASLVDRSLPRPDNRTVRLLDLAMPVYDRGSGVLLGVLIAQIDWQMLSTVILRLHEQTTLPAWLPQPIDLFVLSPDGYVILDNDPSASDVYALFLPTPIEAMAPNAWSGVTPWPDGKTYITAYVVSRGYQDYPGLEYRMLLRQDQTQLGAVVFSLQMALMAVGVACLAIFTVIGFGALRVLMRPLRRIAVAATLLRSGQKQVDLPVYTGADEVSLLSRALQEAFSALHQRNTQLQTLNTSLEQRIEERTAALERNNRELANEIATRKQIEVSLTESRESFRRLAETSFDGIAIAVDGVIIYSNRALHTIFGYEQYELVRIHETDLVAPESRSIMRDIFNLGDHRLHELVGLRKNGEAFPLEISGRTLRYTGAMAHVITVRDLSARRTVAPSHR
jgi:PAS domain S-box-containing protein